MDWWGWVWRRLEVLFRKDRLERELDDEMRFHLEMEIREHLATGLPPDEARRLAHLNFGGMERFKEEVRDVRGARILDDLIQDLKLAVRSLSRRPAFLFAVVGTLAVGIGGNVAMFSVLDASLFASLPYPDTDRLAIGRSTFDDGLRLGPVVSGPDYLDYRDQVRAFQHLGAIAPFPRRATLLDSERAERLELVQVSPNLFRALDVAPVVGRTFLPEESEPGSPAVAVLSRGYWERRFGADPGIVGEILQLDGVSTTIVGVMPPEARFYVDADAWVPMTRGEGLAASRRAHNWLLIARLADGVTLASAQAEVDAVSARLAEAFPDSNRGKGLRLTPLRQTLLEGYRSTLYLLTGGVVLLLLVACANVAGLLLARTNARKGEMAVRAALGADRGRLVRQLLAEGLVLSLAAGLMGTVLAGALVRVLTGALHLDRLGAIKAEMAADSVLAALVLSLVTLVLFGVLPAARASDTDTARDVRGSGRGMGDPRGTRLRSSLVVAQVALTAVLLSGAGLLVRSLAELRDVPLGFDTADFLTAEIELPDGTYSPEESVAFFDALLARAKALPGVREVTLVDQMPLRSPGNNWTVGTPESLQLGTRTIMAHQRRVAPGYFTFMRMPILRGRGLETTDADNSGVVVSESLARFLFGDDDPLGRDVALQSEGEPPTYRVVGVVADAVLDRPAWGAPPAMYRSLDETRPSRVEMGVRFDGDATTVVNGLRELLASLDGRVPLDRPETMTTILRRSSRDTRALAALVTSFGGVALLLAVVGLYGVLAYRVSQRAREIGIRMALGASPRTITEGIIRAGAVLLVLGLIIALPLSVGLGRALRSTLFGVGAIDAVALLTVTLVIGGIGLVASWLPARRAARINPVEAFGTE